LKNRQSVWAQVKYLAYHKKCAKWNFFLLWFPIPWLYIENRKRIGNQLILALCPSNLCQESFEKPPIGLGASQIFGLPQKMRNMEFFFIVVPNSLVIYRE